MKPIARRFPGLGKIDCRQVDFTRFSKTHNPAGAWITQQSPQLP